MIRPLRKYHFYVWRVIVFVLPFVFIFAIALRPESISKYGEIENDFLLEVKKLTNSSVQLTVELKNPLKAPSCLVYVNSGSKEVLLGRIDRKGIFKFEVPAGDKKLTIRLYDAIHKRNIMEEELSNE